jgi:hypothetical protein
MSRHHLHPPSYANELEFTLDFKYPEKHPNGLLVLRSNDAGKGNESIDKDTIFKHLFDPRDRLALKGTLDEDGTDITYVESASPTYFSKEASREEIHKEEKNIRKGLPCEKRRTTIRCKLKIADTAQ